MNIPKILVLALIYSQLIQVRAAQWDQYIRDTCLVFGTNDFKIYNPNQIIKWNLADAWNNKVKIGAGGFGKVYRIPFPFELLTPDAYGFIDPVKYPDQIDRQMAVKLSKFTAEIATEIKLLRILNLEKMGIAYFGCQYTSDETHVIIVQEKSDFDLSDEGFKKQISWESPLKRMLHYQYLFEQAIALYKSGYINNDIKLENMVYSKREDRINIIDFGIGQKVGTPLKCAGTKPYFSPGKCITDKNGNRLAADLIDDLYSLCIAIAALENKRGIKGIYLQPKSRQFLSNCVDYKSDSCVKYIGSNTVNSFMESDFGKPKVVRKNSNGHIMAVSTTGLLITNFKGMVEIIMEYDSSRIDYMTILEIVQNEVDRLKEAEEISMEGNVLPVKNLDLKEAQFFSTKETQFLPVQKIPIYVNLLKTKKVRTPNFEDDGEYKGCMPFFFI